MMMMPVFLPVCYIPFSFPLAAPTSASQPKRRSRRGYKARTNKKPKTAKLSDPTEVNPTEVKPTETKSVEQAKPELLMPQTMEDVVRQYHEGIRRVVVLDAACDSSKLQSPLTESELKEAADELRSLHRADDEDIDAFPLAMQ